MSDDERRVSKERAEFAAMAPSTMPEPTRKLPKKPPTRAEKLTRYQKYGKAPPWRLPPDLIDAVALAAKEQDVRPRDLAEFLVRAGLELLVRGTISLPVKKSVDKPAGKEIVEYPDIPVDYQG
jgi:hypothetical protein